MKEGHIFRKLDAKATVFIEYAPLETAWVPVIGENYFYIYCLSDIKSITADSGCDAFS